jgi:hypothetical protein
MRSSAMGQLSYRLAFDAIEAFVVDQNLEGRDGAWREIVPAEEWGFDEEAWEAAATRIVNLFNQRLPNGDAIEVPPAAKRRSRTEPLINFRRYLAAKADALHPARQIAKMEV